MSTCDVAGKFHIADCASYCKLFLYPPHPRVQFSEGPFRCPSNAHSGVGHCHINGVRCWQWVGTWLEYLQERLRLSSPHDQINTYVSESCLTSRLFSVRNQNRHQPIQNQRIKNQLKDIQKPIPFDSHAKMKQKKSIRIKRNWKVSKGLEKNRKESESDK